MVSGGFQYVGAFLGSPWNKDGNTYAYIYMRPPAEPPILRKPKKKKYLTSHYQEDLGDGFGSCNGLRVQGLTRAANKGGIQQQAPECKAMLNLRLLRCFISTLRSPASGFRVWRLRA